MWLRILESARVVPHSGGKKTYDIVTRLGVQFLRVVASGGDPTKLVRLGPGLAWEPDS